MDDARRWTDDELEALEKRMAKEYRKAAREMRAKQEEWLAKFDREREQREKALDDTEEAMQAHKRWLQSQAARRDWMGDMADQLAESAHQANVRANDMVNGHIPRIFSENANRAAFSIDKALKADTGFTLVNEEAVRHVMEAGMFDVQLIREVVPDAPELGPAAIQSLRKREVDYPKDMRWNRQKFTSAITQGILQGESIPSIVKRTESIYGQNRDAAVRAARTATTNAENAGRMNSFERAQRLGIDMEIEWEATLDGRTRSSHRELDGERIKLGQVFSNGLRWPGDPQGPGHEVWNCRCRADGRVVGFDGKRGSWADERGARWSRLPKGMTYEQWKAGKAVSRAESYGSEAGRVSGAWYAGRTADAISGAQAARWKNAPVLDNVYGEKPKPWDDELESYYLPEATRDRLPEIEKLRTYDEFKAYFGQQGIELTTDLELLIERSADEINAVRDECQKLAVAVDAYKEAFGPEALSKLKRINLYDDTLDTRAAFHFNRLGENDPLAGTLRLRQWDDDGRTIFHELAHAFQDSMALPGEDAVMFAERMTEEAHLAKGFSAYAGASADVYEAERFADAFGYGFAKGNEDGLAFIRSVWEELRRQRRI